MHNKTLFSSVATLCLMFGAPAATAQPDQHNGHEHHGSDHGHHGGDHGGGDRHGGNDHHAAAAHDMHAAAHHDEHHGGRDEHHGGGHAIPHRGEFHGGGHDFRGRGRGHVHHDWSHFRHSGHAHHRYHQGHFNWPHGYHYRRWSFGDFLPSIFFGTQYWLNNWNAYGLYPPPPGTRWVRYGPDALLIDRDTGEVIREEYGVFY